MNALENVGYTKQPGVQDDAWKLEGDLLYGRKDVWFSRLHTFAIIPAVLAGNILNICASGAIFGMMCSCTSSTDESEKNEKQGSNVLPCEQDNRDSL